MTSEGGTPFLLSTIPVFTFGAAYSDKVPCR